MKVALLIYFILCFSTQAGLPECWRTFLKNAPAIIASDFFKKKKPIIAPYKPFLLRALPGNDSRLERLYQKRLIRLEQGLKSSLRGLVDIEHVEQLLRNADMLDWLNLAARSSNKQHEKQMLLLIKLLNHQRLGLGHQVLAPRYQERLVALIEYLSDFRFATDRASVFPSVVYSLFGPFLNSRFYAQGPDWIDDFINEINYYKPSKMENVGEILGKDYRGHSLRPTLFNEHHRFPLVETALLNTLKPEEIQTYQAYYQFYFLHDRVSFETFYEKLQQLPSTYHPPDIPLHSFDDQYPLWKEIQSDPKRHHLISSLIGSTKEIEGLISLTQRTLGLFSEYNELLRGQLEKLLVTEKLSSAQLEAVRSELEKVVQTLSE